MITIEHIYSALRDAVRFYPKASKCLQPQTFAVVESLSFLSTENLGKTPCDRGKPYFFSRLWESMSYNPSKVSFEFPIVAAFEMSSEMTLAFSNKASECTSIQILVADKYQEDCDKAKCNTCDSRCGSEIFRDANVMLLNVLEYLSSCQVVSYGDDEVFLHPKALSDALVANGSVTSYSVNSPATNSFLLGLRQNNSSIDIYPFDGKNGGGKTINDLYGKAINLKFCMLRCMDSPAAPEFRLDKVNVIKDIGCCG